MWDWVARFWCYLLVYKLLGNEIVMQHGPLMIAGALLFLTGLMMFCTGLLGEILVRTYFESQGRRIYAVREVRMKRETQAADSSRHDGSQMLLPLCLLFAQAFDAILSGGRIIDGSGNPWYRADVGITGDRIAAIGDFAPRTRSSASMLPGLVVSPGLHRHS